ncbi:MAG: hypothetical protein ACI9F9_002040, partial [Candidatus Paceibacteria bacterium]
MSTAHIPVGRSRMCWALLTLCLLSISVAYMVVRVKVPFRPLVRPFAIGGDWIRAAGESAYTGCFRWEFDLEATPTHAWITVAARDAFELTINGDTAGRMFLWRPTRPFQNGLSEAGQRLSPLQPALSLNFPREYQWRGHRSHLLPVFLDIRPFLRPGKNVICLDIESRRRPASVRVEGEILLATGVSVQIESGTHWSAEPVPPLLQALDWTHPDADDSQWRPALDVPAPKGGTYRILPPAAFTKPFDGDLVHSPTAASEETVTFEKDWWLEDAPQEGWLRVLSNRPFHLLINGRPVKVALPRNPDYDAGDWILGRERALDVTASPALLDPDEVGVLHVGKRFLQPPHGDPTATAFQTVDVRRNATRDRPRATSGLRSPGDDGESATEFSGESNDFQLSQIPESRTPVALTRDRGRSVLNGYDVTWMLSKGRNHIEVRLVPPRFASDLSWAPSLAMDGEAVMPSGNRVSLRSDGAWSVGEGRGSARDSLTGPVLVSGPAHSSANEIPRLTWRGYAFDSNTKAARWLEWGGGSALLCFSLTVAMLLVAWLRGGRRSIGQALDRMRAVLVVPAVFSTLVVGMSWTFKEMEETAFFMRAGFWTQGLICTAALVPIGMLLCRVRWRLTIGHRKEIRWLILAAVCLLTALARAWALEFQPLDDDEYASAQAILSIARTGAPAFQPEGIWYTRSPLYHYLTAAVVWVFGENLWSLRLPTVFFAVATGVLVYLIGARCLRSRACGLAAMILMAIHPFQIFTGHIARFYQQQQFFALLTAFFFVRAFAQGGGMRARLALIASFLAAVLSQEISIVMGFQLLTGFAMFSAFPNRSQLFWILICSLCAIALIFVDVAAFKVLCLTRTEGISPSPEATIRPNFTYPYNFTAIFLGYSRTHLMLSLFWLVSLVSAIRRGSRERLALHFLLISGVVLTNVFVTHVSLRYQYWLIPIWILLGVDGVSVASNALGSGFARLSRATSWVSSA